MGGGYATGDTVNGQTGKREGSYRESGLRILQPIKGMAPGSHVGRYCTAVSG